LYMSVCGGHHDVVRVLLNSKADSNLVGQVLEILHGAPIISSSTDIVPFHGVILHAPVGASDITQLPTIALIF
jgi:hypothetical protein